MPPSSPGRYDVAIAGAGLAGGSLALRLATAGLRVALLDQGHFPREKLCGEFLSPEAWGALDRLGLASAVVESGYQPIRHVRLSTPSSRTIEAEIIGPDGLPGIGLSRNLLDNLLLERACSAGVEVFEGTRVGGPIVEDGRVVGLLAKGDSPSSIAVRATVVVAADGRHSSLTRRTGTTRTKSRFRPRYFGLKRHLASNPPDLDTPTGAVGLHSLPGGYVGTCRVEGSMSNLCALLPESLLRRHRGDLDRLAATEFRRNPTLARFLGSSVPVGPWKTVSGVRVEASVPRLPGIFYAGDCRGTVDPLGGQGMTMALLGAESLTPIVVEAVRRGEADGPLQRAYEAAWHRRFDRRIALCRGFHHALINPPLLDMASHLGRLAPRLLSACYGWTREPAS